MVAASIAHGGVVVEEGVTLRTRLTTAFLAMVLGPVVLGALFVGITVNTVSANRAAERMDHASSAVRTSIGALCAQLRTVAEALAAAPPERRLSLGAQYVERGLVGGVHFQNGVTTIGAPPPPWADCAGPESERNHETLTTHEAIAAHTDVVSAAFTVDADLLRRLSEASGARVVLVPTVNPQSRMDNRVGLGRLSLLQERSDRRGGLPVPRPTPWRAWPQPRIGSRRATWRRASR
jgi:hypothetical protein